MQVSIQKHSGKSVPSAREAAKEPGAPILSSDQSASEQAPSQTRCPLQAAPQFLGKLVLAGALKASYCHAHFLPKKSLWAHDPHDPQQTESTKTTISLPTNLR